MDGLEVIGHGLQLPQNVRMDEGGDALACFGGGEHPGDGDIDDEEFVGGEDYGDDQENGGDGDGKHW